MKLYLAVALVAILPTHAQTAFDSDSAAVSEPAVEADASLDANVNSRYTVESVDVTSPRHYRLSHSLLDDIQRVIGAPFNDQIFKNLAERISAELHGYQVGFKLARGSDRDHIRVNFDIQGPKTGFDVDFQKLVYSTREGASGESNAVFNAGSNSFTFGVVSDADSMIQRASGIRARYDRWDVVKGRVNLGFEFDSFHDAYNSATRAAAIQTGDSLYGTRRSFEPSATIVLAGPLTWTVGLSFDQFQQDIPAARTETASAVVNTLRYDRHWEDSGSGTHRFNAGYGLRAATNFLGGAYAYTRHLIDATYHWKRGRHQSEVSFHAGAITGQAPLYERFVLGTGNALRGWDKYDVDPLGGSRVVYGSVGYGYRMVRVFYDTGAVWDRTKRAAAKQSAGIGVKVEGILFAVAFPMRGDHMEPVFIAGMNF